MRHITVAILTLTLLGGCVVGDNDLTVADGTSELAPGACERMYRCDHARFHEVFSNVEACVAHVRSIAEGALGRVDAARVDECAEWLEVAACDAEPYPCAWAIN